MELSIGDRITLLNLLPNEGDLVTITVTRDIANKLNFNQDEIQKCELKFEKNSYRWNTEKSFLISVDFTEREKEILKGQVEKLDSEKKINVQNLDICLKIKES